MRDNKGFCVILVVGGDARGSLMSAAGIFGHSRGHEREYIHYYICSFISMMSTQNKGILSIPKSECHVLFLWHPIGR